jgi:Fungal Zn(2)-Cys(6) binuclear cluster domain
MTEITSSTTDNTTRAVRRRRRPPRSCAECRRRKVKCDRKEPCMHCGMLKKQCVYTNEVMQSGNRAESTTAPRLLPSAHFTPLQIQQSTTQHLETEHAPILISPQSTTDAESNEITEQSSSTAASKEHQTNELDRRHQTLERTVSLSAPGSVGVDKHPLSGPSSSHEARFESRLVSDKTKATLNKSRLFGPTHWTNDVDEVSSYISQWFPPGMEC